MGEFFAMGGYAAYVWPSYGATALLLGALTYWSLRRNAKTRAELAALEAEGALRRRATADHGTPSGDATSEAVKEGARE